MILVANKCDASLGDYAETTGRVERRVKHLLNEWQDSRRSSNRRNGGDVTVVRLRDGVSRTSCVDYVGIVELLKRISWEGATSIQVPPAWDLALKVLDALRAGVDPLRAARAHYLGLDETSTEIGETIQNTYTTKNELLKLWEGITRQVSGELQNAEDIAAVPHWENALNGALWIR